MVNNRIHFRTAKIGALAILVAALIGAAVVLITPLFNESPAAFSAETAGLKLSADTVAKGAEYVAQAAGFQPGEQVRFSWNDAPVVDDTRLINEVSADGNGTALITVRESGEPGRYVIFARGLRSGRQASTSLRVLPELPPTVVGSAKGAWTGTFGGISVVVSQVDRYGNGQVVLHLSAANARNAAVTLGMAQFGAVDDTGRPYGVAGNGTRWAGEIAARQTIKGTIELNALVGSAVRKLSIVFHRVPAPGGFRDLSVVGIEIPTGH